MARRPSRTALKVAVAIDVVMLIGSLVAFRQSTIDALRPRWPWAFDVCGFWTTPVLLAPLIMASFAVFLSFLEGASGSGHLPTVIVRAISMGTALVWVAAITANAVANSCSAGPLGR